MLLRPRQKELVDKTTSALYRHGNTLAVAPTGAGKTIMLSAVLGSMFESGKIKKACVLAHRDELTLQNKGKFAAVNPRITTSVFNAKDKDWRGQTTFAMVQTLAKDSNLQSMPALDALVIDEAHHARAESYMRVIEHAQKINPDLKLLGMTATPSRGDKKGLRPVFSNVSDQITVEELIDSGHLVPPRTFVMDIGVKEKLSGVRKTLSDYDMPSVAKIMNKPPLNKAVVRHWKDKAGDRQTVVFCSTVEHANDVTASFKEAGVSVALIWGDMSEADRKDTLAAYGRGDVQVIVNVAVLTEGWDHPPTSCVVLLRPSSYKSTMIQMIGRGLRTVNPKEFPGVIKKDCMVLDFGTSTLMHGSLEQETNLDERKSQGEVPYKKCPECLGHVPTRLRECTLCAHIWPEPRKKEVVTTSKFNLEEIDILAKSNFAFENLDNNGSLYVASGIKSWACVTLDEGDFYAIGGRPNVAPQLLTVGNRSMCFAAANDWLNIFETNSKSHKDKKWLKRAPTPRQLEILGRSPFPPITRYKASALITMKFNKGKIKEILNDAKNQSLNKKVA